MNTPKRCRVLIVDNNSDLALTLIELLKLEPDLEPVGWTDSAASALGRAAELAADLLVLDLSLPDGSGLGVIDKAAAAMPRPGIILYTGHASRELADRAVARGADACVVKGGDVAELFAAIRRVHADRSARA